jgi:hypothetical protein
MRSNTWQRPKTARKKTFTQGFIFGTFKRRHDTRHSDIQPNDTQHNNKNTKLSITTLHATCRFLKQFGSALLRKMPLCWVSLCWLPRRLFKNPSPLIRKVENLEWISKKQVFLEWNKTVMICSPVVNPIILFTAVIYRVHNELERLSLQAFPG